MTFECFVCSLPTIPHYEDRGVRHMISILDPGMEAADWRPAWINPEHHHAFFFADVTTLSDSEAPTWADMRRLIDVGRQILHDPDPGRVLIHCRAGVSRSPAAAFVLHCLATGAGHEVESMRAAAHSCRSEFIWPNGLMVTYADEILGRQGAMVRALTAWQEGVLDNDN